MTFSPDLGFWSPFIFWFCVINGMASILFTVVVIVGGVSDLRYLLRALREEAAAAEAGESRTIAPEHSRHSR